MWTCRAFNRTTGSTCNTKNPDDTTRCAACGSEKPVIDTGPPVKFRWALIIAGFVLFITMLLPILISSSASIDFLATSAGIERSAEEETERDFLDGAIHENRISTLSTSYDADFVPMRLTSDNLVYAGIQFLYGPVLITGVPIVLTADSNTQSDGLDGTLNYHFTSLGLPVIFYILLIVFFLALHAITKNNRTVLNFVGAFTLVWLAWSLILIIVGHWTTAPLNDLANLALTEQQGHGNFVPSILRPLDSVLRVFVTGMFYWLVATLLQRARSEPANFIPTIEK